MSQEDMQKVSGKKIVPFGIAITIFIISAFIIGFSILKLGVSAHIPMVIAACVAALVGMFKLDVKWETIEKEIVNSIDVSVVAILILLLVGLLVGSWIAAGTVPTLIYYGLKILSPKYFLAAGMVSCSIIAVSCGSSWTTAGTIGLALMGVGAGLGIPAPMTAGCIISGSYFGDKMSPMSDTTNLAPAVAGNDLFDHIRAMMWTTIPTYIIVFAIYMVMGFRFSADIGTPENIALISGTMEKSFHLGLLTLLPPLYVVLSAVKKWPALPSLVVAITIACLLAIFLQGMPVVDLLNVLQEGYVCKTGVEMVDSLLSRGGLDAMMWTVSLIVCAVTFGGVMKACGILESILFHMRSWLKSPTSLIGSTLVSCYFCDFFLGDQFLGIIVPGRTFKDAYDKMGLAPRMLSRSLEDSATIVSPLIPWTACGAYMSGVLGVGSFEFLPYAFFNWMNPLIALLLTAMGFGVFWKKKGGGITLKKSEADIPA